MSDRPAILALALAGATVLACDSTTEAPGTMPPDTTPPPPPTLGPPPSVVSVTPSPNGFAAADAEVVIRFDKPVVRIPASFLSVFGRWSGAAAGAITFADSVREIHFTPTRPFFAGEQVMVSVSKGLAAGDGEATEVGYAWSFWIESAPGSLNLGKGGQLSLRRAGEGLIRSHGAYAGDFDRDGDSDLLISNEVADDIRVLLNNGSGGYDSMTVYPVPGGDTPSPNEGADFNGDGLIDVAIGNTGNDQVSIFLGTTGGGLAHDANYTAGDGVGAVCVLDFDSDGRTDIVTPNPNAPGAGNVTGLRNSGGGFARTFTIPDAGLSEKSCAVGDANEDGISDVFVGSLDSNEITLLMGDGQGDFTLGGRVALANGRPWMIAAGDVSGDGHIDVVAANQGSNTFAVSFGDGTGGMGAARHYPVGLVPVAIDLGDLDGDGDLDVVTSNFTGGDFTVYENLGDGTYANQRSFPASSAGSCAILHDRDNDGDLDLTGIDELDDVILFYTN